MRADLRVSWVVDATVEPPRTAQKQAPGHMVVSTTMLWSSARGSQAVWRRCGWRRRRTTYS